MKTAIELLVCYFLTGLIVYVVNRDWKDYSIVYNWGFRVIDAIDELFGSKIIKLK